MEGKVPDLSDVVDECPIFGQGARVVDSAINVGNQCPVLAEVFDKPEPSPCEVGVNLTLPAVVNGYRDKLIAGCGFEPWPEVQRSESCGDSNTNSKNAGLRVRMSGLEVLLMIYTMFMVAAVGVRYIAV
jgi:hypothetical protein